MNIYFLPFPIGYVPHSALEKHLMLFATISYAVLLVYMLWSNFKK